MDNRQSDGKGKIMDGSRQTEKTIISERITYLPADIDPISSDVIFVRGDKYEWIFDVGCNDAAAELIQGVGREIRIVLSHFHQDHIGNIGRVPCGEIYCGSYTYGKVGRGQVISEPCVFEDGCRIMLFPIPCSHAKGSVGLEVDGEYAFLGDAAYCMTRAGKACYNVSLLHETICTLEDLEADKFLLSHADPIVKSKDAVIDELKSIYRIREAGEAYIYL